MKQRKISLWRKKTDKKDSIKVTIVTEENQQIYQSQSEWNIERCIRLQLYDSIDFENLTGKFWIKTSGNYNSKELSLKADGVKFQLAK